jgi:fused signal recognition particle receptor
MVFWRRQKNPGAAEAEAQEQRLFQPEGEPALEPPVEYDAEIDPEAARALDPTESEMLEDMRETPLPSSRTPGRARSGSGWLSRLTLGLSKSAGRLTQGVADLMTKRRLDAQALAGLEDVLIQADCGPAVAAQIVEAVSQARFGQEATEEEVRAVLASEIERILSHIAQPLAFTKPKKGPFVLLMCGVNGSGKTTTAGKIAHHLAFREKKRVMLAACDTFRAAAVEQLAEWAERAGCRMAQGEIGADAGAVAFQAYEEARAVGKDVLIVDTAGRLQNQANLMAELGKIVRVLQKQDPEAPHGCLLVLDGTAGQNAHAQVEVFGQAAPVSGLVVTKLDGAAKGGVVVALAQRFGTPIPLVGVGEGAEDLQAFTPRDYARALVGLPTG